MNRKLTTVKKNTTSFLLRHAMVLMVIFGLGILSIGMTHVANAVETEVLPDPLDVRMEIALSRFLGFFEGTIGLLVMTLSSIAAIGCAVFGAYRASISLLGVSVIAYILRILGDIFYNFDPGSSTSRIDEGLILLLVLGIVILARTGRGLTKIEN